MNTEHLRNELADTFEHDRERLRAVALRILRDPTEAEDAVQDAFASACRSLDSFRGQARLSTWLHRIVSNAALMRLRSRRRRPECPFEEDWEAPEMAETRNPYEEISRRQLCAQMLEVASELDPDTLELLAARYFRDEPLGGIARRHRISTSAAKTRVHRARASLRALMKRAQLDPELQSA